MFGRLKVFGQLAKTGRLALRLARDSRVPMTAKLVLGGTLLYLISPIDVVPDWLPLAGQADDLMVLLAGLQMFIKASPRRLVDEHEGKIDRDDPLREHATGAPRVRTERRDAREDEPLGTDRRDRDADAVGAGARRGSGTVIEGQYRRVR